MSSSSTQPLACFINAWYLSSRICSISGSFTFPFLSLSFITSMAPLDSDCGREFNKCVLNVSSSIQCPVIISSVCFFSMKASQSVSALYFLTCNLESLCTPPLYLPLSLDSTFFQAFPRLFLNLLLSIYWMCHSPQCSMIFHQLTSQGFCNLSYWMPMLLIYLSWSSVLLPSCLQVSQSILFCQVEL